MLIHLDVNEDDLPFEILSISSIKIFSISNEVNILIIPLYCFKIVYYYIHMYIYIYKQSEKLLYLCSLFKFFF